MLKVLFYVCVFFLSLGQFSAVYKSGGTNLYLFDASVIFFALFGLLYFLTIKKWKVPVFLVPLLVFSFIAILSLSIKIPLLSSNELLVASFYLFRWVFYLLAAFVIYNMLSTGMILEKEVVRAFIISGLFVSLAGFAQLVLLPDFETLDPSLGWDPHKNRLASTFFDPNFTGGYLVLCLVLLLRNIRISWKHVLSAVIILTAIFLTFSRSAWAMLAVVTLVYGILKYRWLLLLSALIAFSAYFLVPRVQTRIAGATDPADSAHFRIISWKNTLKIAQGNLLTGVGYNTFRSAQKEYGLLSSQTQFSHSSAGSDSSFLLILATTGIFGLIAFASTFLFARDLSLLAIFGGLLLHSQFVNSLLYPQILFLWLISFVAISYSLHTSH